MENIKKEIDWYNNETKNLAKSFSSWLEKDGHSVSVEKIDIKKNEEMSGNYDTVQYNFTIDNDLKFSLEPYGIWIVGARGRLDLKSKIGSEKLVYLSEGGLAIKTETKDLKNNIISSPTKKLYSGIDAEGWYILPDSPYDKPRKFDENIVEPLLERLQ